MHYRRSLLALVTMAMLATPAWAINQRGIASWYGPRFHGQRAASGEVFNEHRLTAAHRTLPFGTVVRVTNLENGQSVVVRINDRGPYVKGTILDLSHAAAERLDMIKQGRALVALSILEGARLADVLVIRPPKGTLADSMAEVGVASEPALRLVTGKNTGEFTRFEPLARGPKPMFIADLSIFAQIVTGNYQGIPCPIKALSAI